MTTAGPNLPGSGVDSNLGDSAVAWSNPGRITANDSSFTTIAVSPGTDDAFGDLGGHGLHASTWGFAIPAGSVINGMQVQIQGQTTGVSVDIACVPAGSAPVTGNRHITLTTTLGLRSTGGAADQWTGANDGFLGSPPTATQINAIDWEFGTIKGVTSTVSIDYIQITITYTPVGGLPMTQVRGRQAVKRAAYW